ncbi:hypothetical protein HW130_02955 [Streptomyces sp. PKU-EA00015]|uniref:hypothetical protein n=1 Tax=Streptomyces sp. PKU-EA00015 TaxID=2748326 RepID=UPI0015A08FEB|nr:hypothetical protein [Streptomyces sp. PKU-EA00015]NWF25230.1 hypothetical protein [Streptomyces sp. PKU-EA00015]
MAIQVGSVEVDVVPNTRGIYAQLQQGLVPAATQVGDDMGRVIARRLQARITPAIRDGINAGARAARPSATRQGDETAGAFSRALRTRLQAAFRSLPQLQIGADTSEADSDLQALRVRMETLANKRIGIDIDAAAAKTEIRALEAELTRLGASHPNVQVRADTAAARAELVAVRAQIDAVDGKRARIDVDTSGAIGAVLHLTAAIAGLAIIPAVPVLVAGIGAIGSAAIAASVGVGALAAVAAPAFVGIAGALQAQKQAQEAATTSTLRGAQAASQGASRALQMAGAQQALAAAERNGARQIAQAQQQVRQAKTAVADAVMQAAQRNAQAARAIEDAERNLARSQQDAKRAQEDLTDARREAARELEDLNAQLAGAELSQRDAQLGVREAQAELNRVRKAGSKASALDVERAQLAYDQAVQRLKEQTTETKRLKQETADANKAGVDGSDTVRAAQERVAQAQQQVEDRTRAVRDAQAEAARTQVETARQVAQAQERVSEATANVAVAQQSAADAVANAQRQIASASLSAAGGVDQAAIAQAKYEAALAKMTPAARQTFNAFTSLRTAFGAWSRSLQPAVMPIFTRALNGIKNSLPGLTPFVLAAAKAIGNLQDRISRGFKSPWWKQFKKDLAGSVGPAIEGLGISFGRIFKGMAGVVQAFLPHMTTISGIMQRITGRFANWATNLKGSPQFEKFLSYSAEMGPVVARALGDIIGAVLQVAKALAPAATVVYLALGAVAKVIGSIAEHLPWLIQLIYGVWVATKLWTLAMIAFNLVMNANPITLIIIAIVALVAAVIYAYKNWGWFRDIVDAVWSAIKTASLWVWNNVLKPVFNGIWQAIKLVGAVALWLWENIFRPVLGWIGDKASWLWNKAIKPAWDNIQLAMDIVGRAISKLWKDYAQPILGWIGDKGKWLWEKALKPAWDNIKRGIDAVGKSFETAKNFIRTAWDKIQDIAKKPVKFIMETVYNKGIVPTWNKIATAFGANELKPITFPKGFARGGVLPGTSSWRQGDDQLVPMRRGEGVYVSEAMRDPYERARLFAVNRAAMQGKSLTPFQGFAKGGIFDWVGDKASAGWDLAKSGVSWLKDGLQASAIAGMNKVVKPLIDKISGSASLYRDMISGVPKRMLKTIFGYSGEADKKLKAAGIGGKGYKSGLSWARTQHGLPYQWGGNGNPSWDCSGFLSAIESVIRGQKPHRRWATGAFSGRTAPGGWVLNHRSPFMIGITNAGVGHTAGTINGTNVESRGGDGVLVGSRARSYHDPLFTDVYGFKYDSGGYLQPGMNLAYNGTGRPEPVFTSAQAKALTSMAASPAGDTVVEGTLVLDSGELMGKFQGVLVQRDQALISTLRAGRKG